MKTAAGAGTGATVKTRAFPAHFAKAALFAAASALATVGSDLDNSSASHRSSSLFVGTAYGDATVPANTRWLYQNNDFTSTSGVITVVNPNSQAGGSAVTIPNSFRLSGDGWLEGTSSFGALRIWNGTTVTGDVTFTGDARISTASTASAASAGGTITGRLLNDTDTGAHKLTLGLSTNDGRSGDASILTLTGDNVGFTGDIEVITYTGLRIGDGGSSGNLAGGNKILLSAGNAQLRTNVTSNIALTGELSGIGAFYKDNIGTTTLTAVNPFTGSTTVLGGTLAFTGAATLEASAISLTNTLANASAPAALDISGVAAATFNIKSLTASAGSVVRLGAANKLLSVGTASGTAAVSGTGKILVKANGAQPFTVSGNAPGVTLSATAGSSVGLVSGTTLGGLELGDALVPGDTSFYRLAFIEDAATAATSALPRAGTVTASGSTVLFDIFDVFGSMDAGKTYYVLGYDSFVNSGAATFGIKDAAALKADISITTGSGTSDFVKFTVNFLGEKFYKRTWGGAAAGEWLTTANWNTGAMLPAGSTGDRYVVTGSHTITIPPGETIKIVGNIVSGQSIRGTMNSWSTDGADPATNDALNLLVDAAGFYYGGSNGGTLTISGGTLDTGVGVPGAYAIISRAAYSYLILNTRIIGSGNIGQLWNGSGSRWGLQFAGDASEWGGELYTAADRRGAALAEGGHLGPNSKMTVNHNNNGQQPGEFRITGTSKFAASTVDTLDNWFIHVTGGIAQFYGDYTIANHGIRVPMTVDGSGVAAFSEDRNFSTENVTVSGSGGLQFIKDGAILAKNITINDSVTVKVGSANTDDSGSAISVTYAGIFSGSSSLTKTGKGELILTGANTFGGAVNVNGGGTLTFSSDANLGSSTAVNSVSGGSTLRILGGTTKNWNVGAGGVIFDVPGPASIGTLAGANPLTKTGAGSLRVDGGATFTGTIRVENGSLVSTTTSATAYLFPPKIEVFPGASLDVGGTNPYTKNTIRLNGTGGNATSFAGHIRGSLAEGFVDVAGNIELGSGHTLRVGPPKTVTSGTADFYELTISGGGLTFNNEADTLHLDILDLENHDTVTLLNDGKLAVNSSTAHLSIGTVDGILLPGEYTLVTATGGFGASISNTADATNVFASSGVTASLGLTASPSLINELAIDDDGDKPTLKLVVKTSGVGFIWNDANPAQEWDLSTVSWEEHNATNHVAGPSKFIDYGDARLIEGRKVGQDYVNHNLSLSEDIKAVGITIEDLEGAPDPSQGYTLTLTKTDSSGGRLLTGGILKTSHGVFTLDATPDATVGHAFVGAVKILAGEIVVRGTAAIPVIANKDVPSLLGAAARATDLAISSGATLTLEAAVANVTNRSFAVGGGEDGGTLAITGERVTFAGVEPIALVSTVVDVTNKLNLFADAEKEGVLNLQIPVGLKVEKTGGGTWWLTGESNQNAGQISVTAGVLALSNAFSVGGDGLLINGGVVSNLASTGTGGHSFELAQRVYVGAAGGGISVENTTTLALRNALFTQEDGAVLTKTGGGTLVLGAENTAFAGVLNISNGFVRLDAHGATGTGSVELGDAGTLRLNVAEVELHSLTATGAAKTGVVDSSRRNATATLNLNIADGTVDEFAGSVRDGLENSVVALRKTGAGTLVLSGENNFTGAVTVENGLLVAQNIARTLGGVARFEVKTAGGISGSFDVNGLDFVSTGKTATIAGAGYTGLGAVLDGVGGGGFPAFVLTGDATVKTAGSSVLAGAVSGLPAQAATPVLTLAPEALGAANRTFFIGTTGVVPASPLVSRVALNILPGATLDVRSGGSLASSTVVQVVGNPGNHGTDGTLRIGSGVVQILASLGGSGSVSGAGQLTTSIPAGVPSVFEGTLLEHISVEIVGAGRLTLAPASGVNQTDGVLTVNGGTLDLAIPLVAAAYEAVNPEFDILGKRPDGDITGSRIILEDGVLLSTYAAGYSRTDRAFTLAGATTTISSGLETPAGDTPHGLHFTPDSTVAVDIPVGVEVHRLTLDARDTKADNLFETPLNDSAETGALALVKTGPGAWRVGENTEGAAVNSYRGGTFIQNGTLILNAANAITRGGTLVLGDVATNASGALKLDGHDLELSAISAVGEGIANRIYNGLEGPGSGAQRATPTLTLNLASGNSLFSGSLGLPGDEAGNRFSLVKDGAGTLTLRSDPAKPYIQSYTFTGDTTVRAGTLAVSGVTRLVSPNVTVFPGATLDSTGMSGDFGFSVDVGQVLTAGGTFLQSHYDVLGSLTLNGGTLVIGSGATNATGRVLNAAAVDSAFRVRVNSTIEFHLTASLVGANSTLRTRTLTVSPNAAAGILVNPVNATLAIGSYTLATSTTALSGFENFYLIEQDATVIDPRYSLALVNDTATNSLLLSVASTATAATALTWRGDVTDADGNHLWDSAAENFAGADGAPVAYFPGDTAFFDDTAVSGSAVVGVNTSIGCVTFHNNALDYTVSGQAIVGEGWIEKRGDGTLTLLSANSYNGLLNEDGTRRAATVLAGGTLEVGNDLALGYGSVYVVSAATLRAVGTGARSLANDIVLRSAVTVRLDAGVADGLELAGKLTGDNSTGIVKVGVAPLYLAPDGSGFTGVVTAAEGGLVLFDADYSRAVIDIAAGASLEVHSVSQAGELRGVAGSILTGTGTLETGGRGAGDAVSTFAGDITGLLGIVKVGALGKLTLTGDNSAHLGPVTVREGRLQIGDGVSGKAGTGNFTVEADATLVFNLPVDTRLDQELTGAGTLEKQGTRTLVLSRENSGLAGRVRISEGTLNLVGAGALGTADIEIPSGTLLLSKAGNYEIANNITGSGSLVKDGDPLLGSGTATWLGTGGVRLKVQSGVFSIGDGVRVLEQTQMEPTAVSLGATLVLAPAEGGSVVLGDIESATGAAVQKTGAGRAVLTGLVGTTGGISVLAGTLEIGAGDGAGEIGIPGALDVSAGATLTFNRIGSAGLAGRVAGAGAVRVASGVAVLQNAGNALSGSVAIEEGAVLQVGWQAAASTLGSAELAVAIANGGTLRFNNVVAGGAAAGAPVPAAAAVVAAGSPSALALRAAAAADTPVTGANLVLSGYGIVEQSGSGELRQNSNTTDFAGTFLASSGVFVFDAATLPTRGMLDATGAGVLRIESAVAETAALSPTLGDGDGTVLLAPAANNPTAAFSFPGGVRFSNGTLAVGAGASLSLFSAAAINTKELHVRQGGTLTGSGTLNGNVRNDGSLAPKAGAVVEITGDLTIGGALVLPVGAAGATAEIKFAGAAVIASSAVLRLETTREVYDRLLGGTGEIGLFHDTQFNGTTGPDISGAFASGSVTVSVDGEPIATPTLAYNTGDGWLALILSDNIRDIPAVKAGLHEGNEGFADYLTEALKDPALNAVVQKILTSGAADVSVNAASPAGLASVTGMALGSARDDAANLHTHLEASRFSRFYLKTTADTGFYVTGTGHYEQNAGVNGPAYDYNIYGGSVGIDHAIGGAFLAGVAASYHKGRATLDYGGGSVAQDNTRVTAYGSIQALDFLYVDAEVHGGYSTNDVKQRSVGGVGRAKPEGFDFGASVLLGGAVGIAKDLVYATPYAGFEYDYARVDGFTEKGGTFDAAGNGGAGAWLNNGSALAVGGFNQESLRFKVGTGVSWFVPVKLVRTVRASLDFAYAYEFLDTETAITGRFATDYSGRGFRVAAPALSRHTAQIAPSVDIGFTEKLNLQFGYRFESDFDHQTSHHISATFRLRF
jgi:autotransporter-associated beta strand protein